MIGKKLIYLCIALSAVACENDIQAVMDFDSKKAAVENGTNIEAIFSQRGKVNAKLTAPAMERSLDKPSYVKFKQGLKVLMFNDTLGVESTLTADTGRYMEDEGAIFLSKNVVVVNKKGDRLKTDELNWDPKKKVFYSTKEVFIKTPTDSLHGWGLIANEDFTDRKIINVSGPITVQDSLSMQ
ncbi:LPS export ABC transporter periplasmic protein LptC [Chitinophaga oryzae]|uniref:LPS export ABC transporter periplasmic protein LptC n=1 Tax=Chitinophaga oryzae TaxID=2725414 RepID=A0AAE6ZL44_9BACT|nr:LPS export ABC transporter periplasmic protein LptC [Chitinophaga oryzae]QJB34679.1 LPS export ABC transporter periplasmic protein LptC [Chitinophaga oryzae]QJB41197.1 LPS export ABC transporter periplasmic protein LptC [Chitinophaga oryzae]